MSVFDKVKGEAMDAHWHSIPYRGFGANAPSSTFNDIVSLAFDNATKTMNHARHCSLYEMYNPILGSFRRQKSYTSLAPSLCISHRNRLWKSDRGEYSPHNAYKPKQGEWLVERDRRRRTSLPHVGFHSHKVEPHVDLHPSRHFNLPVDTTRFDNYFLYWRGRACGLDNAAPFLQPEDYRPMEQRRYERLYWAPEFIDLLPSCRHARQLMLTAY